jgi:uncharacterized membrane protein
MTLKIWEIVSILLSALVGGMFWGPWVGLSRSIATFKPEVFLAIGHRMGRNFAAIMPILMPAALLAIVPVLLLARNVRPELFNLFLAGQSLFVLALLVTLVIEVPIVNQIRTWTPAALPDNWQQLRNRWAAFHVVRVVAAITGLALLVTGAVCG